MNKSPAMKNEIWLMKTEAGFYRIQPTIFCKPEDHGELNPHVLCIEDMNGRVLWRRKQDA